MGVEEAVQDVKRAAMGELQRALTTERARAERLAAEARRQGAEETLLALGRHSQVKEVTQSLFHQHSTQSIVHFFFCASQRSLGGGRRQLNLLIQS